MLALFVVCGVVFVFLQAHPHTTAHTPCSVVLILVYGLNVRRGMSSTEAFLHFRDIERFGPKAFWFTTQEQVDLYFSSRKAEILHGFPEETPIVILELTAEYLGPPTSTTASDCGHACMHCVCIVTHLNVCISQYGWYPLGDNCRTHTHGVGGVLCD